MRYVHLRDVELENTYFKQVTVILDDSERLVFLPLLWSIHLSATQSVFSIERRFYQKSRAIKSNPKHDANLNESDISEKTASDYIKYVYHFLYYLNQESKKSQLPSVHNTELLNSKTINKYLNQILPKTLKGNSLKCHQSAITAYSNFLSSLNLKEPLTTRIYPKTLQYIAEHQTHQNKISYVSRIERHLMLQNCTNDRDRLLLRMGYEVGLRTEENLGLILSSHNAKKKSHKGLIELFSELESSPNKYSFAYTLNGKFTKGGRTRLIYFDRELLTAMKSYYENERKGIVNLSGHDSNQLFIRSDPSGIGKPISNSQASTTFRKMKNKVTSMNQFLSYHDLRHTFATELYHQELNSAEGNETRSESAALLAVQQRLGHSNIDSTKRYIRLRMLMLSMEGHKHAL
jgi:integrase